MKSYLLHFLVLILVIPVFAQQSNFKNYSVQHGLAQSQVYAIEEDHKGYLWLGTRGGGICRFDGVEFQSFATQHGLSSNYILDIYQAKNNLLWIGTSNGLCTYNGKNFSSIDLHPSDEPIIVSTIMEDDENNLWVGTNLGLFVLKDSIFQQFELADLQFKNAISCIIKGKGNDIWVGSDAGLLNIKGNDITHYTTREGLTNNHIRSLVIDNENNLWIGTYGVGISILVDNKIHKMPEFENIYRSVIHHLTSDSKGNIWISTSDKGLGKWNSEDSTLVFFTVKDGLPVNHIRTVSEDSWGNIWIGTSGAGVSKFSGQQFQNYNSANKGLKSDYIFAIESTTKNEIWVSTSGKGVDRYLNSEFVHYDSDSGFVNAKVKVIFQSKDSVVWFGTEGQGIYYFEADSFQSIPNSSAIGSTWIKDIKEDSKGNLWVATAGGGITKIIRDSNSEFSFKRIRMREGLKSNRVNSLLIDQQNKVWYTYQNGGLGYIKNDSLIVEFDKSNGLPSNDIRCLREDTLGNLWIGTAGKGVIKLKLYQDSVNFITYGTKDGLSSDNVYLLEIDKEYNLWVGTEKGVDQVKLDLEGNFLEVTNYGKDEGFTGVETSRNAATLDGEGNIWFGTINGLFKYISGSNIINKKPPVLSITNVSLFYDPLINTPYSTYLNDLGELDSELILDYDWNHVTFDFHGIVLTLPKKVNYKWMLEGLESEWSPISNKTSITYSNLSPGKYTFKVLSMNENGVWNENPQTIKLEILIPFWLTNWFLYSGIAVGLFIIMIIVGLRLRNLKRRASLDQEMLRMENEVLVLEQKALRLQMNPHFIFNCLNTIQSMIVKKDNKSARYYLSKFSKLMRKILDNSRKSFITLDDEIETLETYLSIEKFCSEDHFDYSIHVNEELVSDFLEIPPMIIQPFVENAIVHGVSNKKNKGLIEISFSQQNAALICIIQDNGIGRDKAFKIASHKEQQHKSTALIVTQERLERLSENGNNQHIEIEDLTNEKGDGIGTKITVTIPLND